MKKAYVFLIDGFEEIEAIATIDVLRRAEVETVTVSLDPSRSVKGGHDIVVEADVMFEDADFQKADMLILPGGQTKLGECSALCELLVEHNKAEKMIAAICAAPMVLGKLGILKGKQATCYPGCQEPLGESYVGGLVVESKNIITAKGPGLSSDFAFCIIERLADCR